MSATRRGRYWCLAHSTGYRHIGQLGQREADKAIGRHEEINKKTPPRGADEKCSLGADSAEVFSTVVGYFAPPAHT